MIEAAMGAICPSPGSSSDPRTTIRWAPVAQVVARVVTLAARLKRVTSVEPKSDGVGAAKAVVARRRVENVVRVGKNMVANEE